MHARWVKEQVSKDKNVSLLDGAEDYLNHAKKLRADFDDVFTDRPAKESKASPTTSLSFGAPKSDVAKPLFAAPPSSGFTFGATTQKDEAKAPSETKAASLPSFNFGAAPSALPPASTAPASTPSFNFSAPSQTNATPSFSFGAPSAAGGFGSAPASAPSLFNFAPNPAANVNPFAMNSGAAAAPAAGGEFLI